MAGVAEPRPLGRVAKVPLPIVDEEVVSAAHGLSVHRGPYQELGRAKLVAGRTGTIPNRLGDVRRLGDVAKLAGS